MNKDIEQLQAGDQASEGQGQALLQGERLDDLMTKELQIIQSREVFSFSMDAVLLARFASIPPRGRVVDLCTGNGVIPLLLSTRTRAAIDAVEIQPRLADMAKRSVKHNQLDDQIHIIEGDLRTYPRTAGQGIYDAVTVNPPYMQTQTGDQNENEHYAIARHEIHCTLDEVVEASARLVRTGGKVSMVHRPNRLMDILESFRRWKLEPKRIRFVHPHAEAEANMLLIEAIRDGKPSVKLLPPLIVYTKEREYTEELKRLYYGNNGVWSDGQEKEGES
ncbi:tRNA1(Val) (adenine(37)-N6)-methyltransferase [Paenibacillus sp. MMS18-CY102]|uniref:tRNA1(Val) (adenine(37)-N6)-methyltransferase n=1 Tax=Paenibacillus sp. MMS18-CY102 TaxID=2682849 RepID=UPI00136668D9|nr:tRNA1(Val) (adenine(37)-N6)-methyltransferase [Paenibacillus sp. MMS18-CY102]MWC31142.1 methyltransferase [Paenibacillus sp. MMS18-CY102]